MTSYNTRDLVKALEAIASFEMAPNVDGNVALDLAACVKIANDAIHKRSDRIVDVLIKRDVDGEYRVPGPDGREACAYYTDDKDDAIGTANAMYAPREIRIRWRGVRSHS